MKKSKTFFVYCLFVYIVFGFPVIGSGSGSGGSGPGAGGTDPSQYIIGDIHSNQSVSASDIGSNKNFYIVGNISAVGTVISDVNATSTQSGASPINIPEIDFAALQNADGQAIDAPPAWGAGATNQIMYTEGDVSIDLQNCATYQYKTVVATGNIIVIRTSGGHQSHELMANLIARGSIDIDLHGCGSSSYGITGFIFAMGEKTIYLGHDGKGNFTGINIDINGGGHATRSIAGVVMAKNSDIALDMHACGAGDKGIEYADVLINDFNKTTTYWREIR